MTDLGMKAECLFCGSAGSFTTVEHIVPEALGNDDLVLCGHVCDVCQAYFGKEIERYVLSKTPIGFWRAHLGIRGKEGKLARVDLSVSEGRKGVLPEWSVHHDSGVAFSAHADGTCSVEISDREMLRQVLSGERRRFQFVFSPKSLVQIGRFLGKIGLELLCAGDPDLARHHQFDELRRYVRYGHRKEIWPIFHANKGTLEDLITREVERGELVERVLCYDYGMHTDGEYWLFSFLTGIDFWVICMNDQFPTPEIREAYPDVDISLLWYPRETWA